MMEQLAHLFLTNIAFILRRRPIISHASLKWCSIRSVAGSQCFRHGFTSKANKVLSSAAKSRSHVIAVLSLHDDLETDVEQLWWDSIALLDTSFNADGDDF